MNDVSSVLGAHGGGVLLEVAGVQYRLAPATKGIQSQFEAWLKLQARQGIVEQRADLPEDVYADEMRRLTQDVAAGRYAWGGSVMQAAMQEPGGAMYLLYLMARHYDKGFTLEQATALTLSAPDRVAAAVLEALRAGDPNRFPRPAACGAGASGEAA